MIQCQLLFSYIMRIQWYKISLYRRKYMLKKKSSTCNQTKIQTCKSNFLVLYVLFSNGLGCILSFDHCYVARLRSKYWFLEVIKLIISPWYWWHHDDIDDIKLMTPWWYGWRLHLITFHWCTDLDLGLTWRVGQIWCKVQTNTNTQVNKYTNTQCYKCTMPQIYNATDTHRQKYTKTQKYQSWPHMICGFYCWGMSESLIYNINVCFELNSQCNEMCKCLLAQHLHGELIQ